METLQFRNRSPPHFFSFFEIKIFWVGKEARLPLIPLLSRRRKQGAYQ